MRQPEIAVFDNGGKSIDRYTVVFLQQPERSVNTFAALAMSNNPTHPQGFCQHTTAMLGRTWKHLGKRITLSGLPWDCQSIVRAELLEARQSDAFATAEPCWQKVGRYLSFANFTAMRRCMFTTNRAKSLHGL